MSRKDGTPRILPAPLLAEQTEMDNEMTDADWIGYTERNDAA